MNNQQSEMFEPEVSVGPPEQTTALTETGMDRGSMPAPQTREEMEAMLKRAELAIEFQRSFLILALKLTNENDWCYLGKKFFLESSGTKKVAQAFGVFVEHGEPVSINRLKDDKGEYVVVSVPMVAYWQGSKASDVGICSTRDKLFGTVSGGLKPLSEVNIVNVHLKAQTGATRRVINAVLGLNPTEQDMIDAGLDLQKIRDERGVSYGSGTKGGNVDSKELKERKAKTGKKMLEMYGTEKVAADALENMTEFETGDGKKVKGKRTLRTVTEKQLFYVERDVNEAHVEFTKAQKEAGEKGEGGE